MTRFLNTTGLASWLRQATASPVLHRLRIGRHRALCFAFLILMMVLCDGVLLWQLREVRSQVELLKGVDEELIEVLRVHGELFSFYEGLGVAARSEDKNQFITGSEALRSGVQDETRRTEAAFSHLPSEVKVDEAVFPTIETIQNTLLSHLDAIRALADSGEWAAVRGRTDKQIQRLEFLSSQLVKDVARDVDEQRTQAAFKIALVERRIVFTAFVTGFVTLLTAGFFGWATALRIIEIRMEASEERKHAEEALRQAQSDLARANRVSSMGELTASLAHEVNQPIAAAVMDANACLLWLSRDQPSLEEARAAASRIVQSGRRAGEIVNRVRLLFTKDTLQRESVDLNEIIREMVLLLHSEAIQYDILIRTELAADLPPVMGDRVQLQQVLMNLMMNSFDAMRDVNGTRKLIIQSQRDEDGQVLISVSDTGVGLPQKQVDKIFNAFFTTKTHGTGMGLRISRSIIESHEGRLWADNNHPRGARFSFTLPSNGEKRDSAVLADRTGSAESLHANKPVV
ncbi:sensor histidine kinase [Acidicapsa acidisoli]|uniref:sensor histidine kinase n=1 Tax=Acidicapsa acidisoli TaxID=1615681 RepID=UPI0021E049BD|nr:ATP-binding protein [Acidicapsa acidisoli]